MNVTEYARIVHESALRADPAALERVVLAEAPAYAEHVAAVADAAKARAEQVRPQLIEQLQSSVALLDQDAARSLQPSTVRSGCGVILAVFALAGSFAFYFSRGDRDLVAFTPAAMILLAVCAVAFAWSALPARSTAPPPRSSAFLGSFATALGAATLVAAFLVVIRSEPGAMGWVVLGLVSLLALAATWIACVRARRGLPSAKQLRLRLAEVNDELRVSMLALIEGAETAVTAARSLLEPAQRANLEAIQLLVSEQLTNRSIDPTPYVRTPPGVISVGAGVRTVALLASIELEVPDR